MDDPRIAASEKALDASLLTLARGGYVTLEPAPPPVPTEETQAAKQEVQAYSAVQAHPTSELDKLLVFRSVHPLYGAFLVNQLGGADPNERLQALESVLELPRPVLRYVRVPRDLPPGPLAARARSRIDPPRSDPGPGAAGRGR